MFWSTICSLKKGKVVDREIIGPFESMDEIIDVLEDSKQEIRDNGMTPCESIFDLLTDDIPELYH